MEGILAFIAQAAGLIKLAIQVQQDIMPFVDLITKASTTTGWEPTAADWQGLEDLETPLRQLLNDPID